MQVSQVPGVASSGGGTKVSARSTFDRAKQQNQLTPQEIKELSNRSFVEYPRGEKECRELSADQIAALRLQIIPNMGEYNENSATLSYKDEDIMFTIVESDQIPNELKKVLMKKFSEKFAFREKLSKRHAKFIYSLTSYCRLKPESEPSKAPTFLDQGLRSDTSAQMALALVSTAIIGYMLSKFPGVRLNQKMIIMGVFLTTLCISMLIANNANSRDF